MKHLALFSAGAVGSVIASFFGGWSAAMTTLLIFMIIDYVSGLIVAGVFHKSTKSETGSLESRAGLKGLCRKGAMLLVVLIACRLDIMMTTTYIKDMVCIAFILNELISIVENFGLMGVPMPQVIIKAIDILKKNTSEKGAGTMRFDEFIKKYLGRAVDYDGSCGAQCVDLIKMYLKIVLGITPKAIGNAHAYFDNFALHSFLNKNFVRIKNSKKFVPLKGDICVWSKKMNKYGHVSIATGAGDTNKFISYDMNWGGKEMRMVEHDYNYFLGVLRPIDRGNIDGVKLYRVKKAVNIRRGPGTNYGRVMFNEFTAYQQEQVLVNGGKAVENDFPKGMLVEMYDSKGSWYKISDTKEMWAHKNYFAEV